MYDMCTITIRLQYIIDCQKICRARIYFYQWYCINGIVSMVLYQWYCINGIISMVCIYGIVLLQCIDDNHLCIS